MVLLNITFRIDPKLYGDGEKLSTDNLTELFPDDMVEQIAALPGLIWKLWTYEADKCSATGLYLYDTSHNAERRARFAHKHYPEFPGFSNVTTEIMEVMEDLSRRTRAPIDAPANES